MSEEGSSHPINSPPSFSTISASKLRLTSEDVGLKSCYTINTQQQQMEPKVKVERVAESLNDSELETHAKSVTIWRKNLNNFKITLKNKADEHSKPTFSSQTLTEGEMTMLLHYEDAQQEQQEASQQQPPATSADALDFTLDTKYPAEPIYVEVNRRPAFELPSCSTSFGQQEPAEMKYQVPTCGADDDTQTSFDTVINRYAPTSGADLQEPNGTTEQVNEKRDTKTTVEEKPCDTNIQDLDKTTELQVASRADKGPQEGEETIQTAVGGTEIEQKDSIEKPLKLSFCGREFPPSTSWTDIYLESLSETKPKAEVEFKTPLPVHRAKIVRFKDERNFLGVSPGNPKASAKVKASNDTGKRSGSKRRQPDSKANVSDPALKELDAVNDNAEGTAAETDEKKRKPMEKLSAIEIERGRQFAHLMAKLSSLERAQRYSQYFQEQQWRRLVASQRRLARQQRQAQAHTGAVHRLLMLLWKPRWMQNLHF